MTDDGDGDGGAAGDRGQEGAGASAVPAPPQLSPTDLVLVQAVQRQLDAGASVETLDWAQVAASVGSGWSGRQCVMHFLGVRTRVCVRVGMCVGMCVSLYLYRPAPHV